MYQEMSSPEHLARRPPDNGLELFFTPSAFHITAEGLLVQFLPLPSLHNSLGYLGSYLKPLSLHSAMLCVFNSGPP